MHATFSKIPLLVGECICCRADCVAGMYHVFKWRRQKQESGGRKMELGQPSPLSRYPSTGTQVSQKVIVVVAEVVIVDTGSLPRTLLAVHLASCHTEGSAHSHLPAVLTGRKILRERISATSPSTVYIVVVARVVVVVVVGVGVRVEQGR